MTYVKQHLTYIRLNKYEGMPFTSKRGVRRGDTYNIMYVKITIVMTRSLHNNYSLNILILTLTINVGSRRICIAAYDIFAFL